MKDALILFAHGARDERWAAPFHKLRNIVQASLPDTEVSLAFLELMSPRLPETVTHLARQGCKQVSVVPVFLGQGGHVLRDLPLLLDELRSNHPALDIRVAASVGEDSEVLAAIARYCVASASA